MGTLEGLFYIQSNASLSFPTGTRALTAIDISVLNKNDCLSFGEAEYQAIGEYQLYYEYQQEYQEAYVVWEDPPDPPSNDNGGSNSYSYGICTNDDIYGDGSNVASTDWSGSSSSYLPPSSSSSSSPSTSNSSSFTSVNDKGPGFR